MIQATNKATGESIDLPTDRPDDIVLAWQIAQGYEKMAIALKEQLKEMLPTILNERGQSDIIKGYQFKTAVVQRKNYDKAIMREVMDSDLFDTMLKPDKKAVDNYLKEYLPNWSTDLRTSMIDEGQPYTVVKLEKLDR